MVYVLNRMMIFQDPFQKAIGDFRVDYKTKLFATFGISEMTLWRFNEYNFQIWLLFVYFFFEN
jgi:hypothetical protein